MSPASFYTDRTEAPTPRTREEISAEVWRGIVTLIGRRADDGSLAREFPLRSCEYFGEAITGTDTENLNTTLGTLIPQLEDTADRLRSNEIPLLNPVKLPRTPVVLDVIDFVVQHIAEPARRHPHDQHEHLVFEQHSRRSGQLKFRDEVEHIFARNGIAFTLDDAMKVERLGPPEARQLLSDFVAKTGDAKLDELLCDAHARFLSRSTKDRADAVEKLWDAFERLKSLELPADKKASIKQLIDKAVPGSTFQGYLNSECRALTDIGNDFHIRHFEHSKAPLPNPTEAAADYLFTRMAALIAYLLRQTSRM